MRTRTIGQPRDGPGVDQAADVVLGVGIVALAPGRVGEPLLHIDEDKDGVVVEDHVLILPDRTTGHE